jgi:hypothetical protein
VNKFVLGLVGICLAGAAVAGAAEVPDMKEVVKETGSTNGALLLLAMVGLVVASTQIGSFVTRNSNTLDIKPTDADDNAGF